MSKGFKLRLEEYVPAGTFLKTSFVRDRAELVTRFSEFTPDFEAEFSAQLAKVAKLEQTLKLTEEQKGVTSSLYAAADFLNKELNFLSFYFKRADLNSAILTAVKQDLKVRNIEGACLKMEGLIQYVTEQQVILVSKGMAAGFAGELAEIKVDLEAKNVLQNKIMDIKGQLHEDNNIEYKKLYSYMNAIIGAGKIMYDGLGKADEYTMTRILSRMRVVKGNNNLPNT
jgi:hypothetical protein